LPNSEVQEKQKPGKRSSVIVLDTPSHLNQYDFVTD